MPTEPSLGADVHRPPPASYAPPRQQEPALPSRSSAHDEPVDERNPFSGDPNMTTNVKTNGRPRKSLAEQIDRLDGVIDALSEGLNEAVATAVQESVGLAA